MSEWAPEVMVIGPEPRSGRRRRLVASLVAVLAALLVVLVGGGAYVAYSWLSGGGVQPEHFAPRSTFAFAKVDLDPPAAQKLAIAQFAQRFPHSPTHRPGALRDQLLRGIFADSDAPFDYDRDVRPWLGDRAAVAVFTDADGRPRTEFVLQYADRDRADRDLRRIVGRAGFRLLDGYAVLALDQADADEAVRQLRSGNLGDQAGYRRDVARLDGGQVVTGWVDVHAALDAVSRYTRRQVGGTDPWAMLRPALGSQLPSRLVLGAHATADRVEVEVRTLDAAHRTQQLPPQLLRRLPGDTVAALWLAAPGDSLRTAFTELTKSFAFAFAVGAVQKQTGLHLPDDLVTVLGHEAVFALGSVPGEGAAVPDIALRTRPADTTAAAGVVDRLADRIRGSSPLPLSTATGNGTLTVSSTPGYRDRLLRGGDLGSSPAFRAVTGDVPAASAVGYVDLARLVSADPTASADARHLVAAGFVAYRDGGDAVLRVRLLAR